MKKISKILAKLTFDAANLAGDGASVWIAYQPKEPAELKSQKLNKKKNRPLN